MKAYSKKELEIGTKIEMEHTKSKLKARKIAKDHLSEFPHYYTKGLVPMEKKLKRIDKMPMEQHEIIECLNRRAKRARKKMMKFGGVF